MRFRLTHQVEVEAKNEEQAISLVNKPEDVLKEGNFLESSTDKMHVFLKNGESITVQTNPRI